MTVPLVWQCPDCDLKVSASGTAVAAELIAQIPGLHRQLGCEGQRATRRPTPTVAVMPDARPVRVLPGVTVAPHVAERWGVPSEDGDDAA